MGCRVSKVKTFPNHVNNPLRETHAAEMCRKLNKYADGMYIVFGEHKEEKIRQIIGKDIKVMAIYEDRTEYCTVDKLDM